VLLLLRRDCLVCHVCCRVVWMACGALAAGASGHQLAAKLGCLNGLSVFGGFGEGRVQ
jgi:hypothetical protein